MKVDSVPPRRHLPPLLKLALEVGPLTVFFLGNSYAERFGVAGALLVKLFGRPEVEATRFSDRAARVRDIGVRRAMYGTFFLVGMMLVASLATALTYGVGGTLAVAGTNRTTLILASSSPSRMTRSRCIFGRTAPRAGTGCLAEVVFSSRPCGGRCAHGCEAQLRRARRPAASR